MKEVPRNKLSLCFRPVVDMGTVLDTKTTLLHSSATVTPTLAAYLDLEDDEIRTSRVPQHYCRCSTNPGQDCSTISRPPKRTLSRTVRAVVFGTILIKRVRERKSYQQQKSDRRKRNSSLDSGSYPAKRDDKSVNRESGGNYQENRGNQLVSLCSLPCGSSPSFPLSTSKPVILNKKTGGVRRRNAERRSCYAFNSGVGLLVVSLGVTVMQGRVFAILITSIWVYFFARMHMKMEDRWLKKKQKKNSGNRGDRHHKEWLSQSEGSA